MTVADMEQFNTAREQLNARGWLCPEPVIKARLWMREAGHGERLHVIITDPHGELDLQVFCDRSGHRLLACIKDDEADPIEWNVLIECVKTEQ